MSFLANPSGRLIHLSRNTGKLTVLVDKLWFANGVALSPDEDFIVVSDMARSKLVKIWLKPNKFGEIETFAEALPGLGDNLSADKNGLWVALGITADPQDPFIAQSLAQWPLLRKFFARILTLLELLLTSIDKIFPNDFLKSAVSKLGSLNLIQKLVSKRATVLRFDWKGNIIAAYHAYDGSVYTHAMELNGHVYLGTITKNYIARVVKQSHL